MHVRARACLSRPSVVGVAATRGTFEGSVAPRKEPSRRVALPVCLQQKERLSTRESGQTWKNIYIYIRRTYAMTGTHVSRITEKITDLVSFFSFALFSILRVRFVSSESRWSWMARDLIPAR